MKLSTFIKAYKIALSSVCVQIKDWKGVYIGSIIFPDAEDNRVTFIFSSSADLEPGSLGVSASLSVDAVESIKGGLANIALAEEHITSNAKISDVGKVLIVLNNLSLRLRDLYQDDWSNIDITNVWFAPDRGFAYFELDRFKSTVQTDGQLFLFGDPLNDE